MDHHLAAPGLGYEHRLVRSGDAHLPIVATNSLRPTWPHCARTTGSRSSWDTSRCARSVGRPVKTAYARPALRADDRITIELGHFALRKVRGQAGEDGVRETRKASDEKGSDVNVASHLLIDIHTQAIDAAVLVSNDGDLRLPAQHARARVPTGTVNPRGRSTARHLRGEPHDGVGGHWWYRLTAEDFFDNQLPEVVGGARKPANW